MQRPGEGHAVGCFPVAGAEERACRGRGVRASWGDRQRPARRPLVTLLRSTDVVQNLGEVLNLRPRVYHCQIQRNTLTSHT